ncbi:putative toxin-antitoxin system toxin component, PIN family [Candidatus Woesearchaeota archaeon]|nr:putative toxin-antitoxin system toxin component, PIN family [Candidatus Woesearchaeota archaeon]
MLGGSSIKGVRIVVDTNVIISALFWSGDPYRIILKGIAQEFLIFISPAILREFETVLKRDFHVSEQEVEDILSAYTLFLHLIEPSRRIRVVKDDPNDDKIIECALACDARYIVSQDKHLLNLKEFNGIKIVRPEELL